MCLCLFVCLFVGFKTLVMSELIIVFDIVCTCTLPEADAMAKSLCAFDRSDVKVCIDLYFKGLGVAAVTCTFVLQFFTETRRT